MHPKSQITAVAPAKGTPQAVADRGNDGPATPTALPTPHGRAARMSTTKDSGLSPGLPSSSSRASRMSLTAESGAPAQLSNWGTQSTSNSAPVFAPFAQGTRGTQGTPGGATLEVKGAGTINVNGRYAPRKPDRGEKTQ